MIHNLERLIPTLEKVNENIDKEIKIISKVTEHTQAYSQLERVSHLYFDQLELP